MKIQVNNVGLYKIQVIKTIRLLGLGLKEAKELADSFPGVVDVNALALTLTTKEIQNFFNELKSAGADCELIVGFTEDIMEDIKAVMHKCVDANEFGVFGELVGAFKLALKNSEENK